MSARHDKFAHASPYYWVGAAFEAAAAADRRGRTRHQDTDEPPRTNRLRSPRLLARISGLWSAIAGVRRRSTA